MTWIVIVTNLVMLLDGIFVLRLFDSQNEAVYDWSKNFYYSIIGFSVGLHDLGIFLTVWFVTFKYWETSRQYSRMIRIMVC